MKAVQVDAFKSKEINMSCRSDNLKTGVARAPHRSLLKALGFVDEEMGRPVIGIANSFNEIIPGHVKILKKP